MPARPVGPYARPNRFRGLGHERNEKGLFGMDAAYVTALAALGGSIVGSATSIATTFLSFSSQRKIDRSTKESDKRERLYGQFIDEASKLIVQAIRTETEDPAMLVEIGAAMNRMRLFATPEVLSTAEDVIKSIVKLNAGPHHTMKDFSDVLAREATLPLQIFGEACRRELDQIA